MKNSFGSELWVKEWTAALLPGRVLECLLMFRDWSRCRSCGAVASPFGTDGVGYEGVISFLASHSILDLPGDVLEIGTLLGGGALKLSRHLQRAAPQKRLLVVDAFACRWAAGNPDILNFYLPGLRRRYKDMTQAQVFDRVTGLQTNIMVLRGDSKSIKLPEGVLCFGFIDGNHEPSHVENDFCLVWSRLCPGGAVALHDYGWYLPDTTRKIDELALRYAADIVCRLEDRRRHLLYLVKR